MSSVIIIQAPAAYQVKPVSEDVKKIIIPAPIQYMVDVKGMFATAGSASVDNSINIVASESLNAFDVVTGSGRRATSDNIAYRNKLVGIAKLNIANGFSGSVQPAGTITNGAWTWVPGDRIYLNGYALSSTPPASGFLVQIGVAVAANSINIEIQQSILL